MYLGAKLDLNQVAINLSKITFEPEQFPGATLRLDDRCASLLFASGKIVVVGSKSEGQLSKGSRKLRSILAPFLHG
jgi:TATA-box binding protein (TBP) (component of TFIID and TFIIIB)